MIYIQCPFIFSKFSYIEIFSSSAIFPSFSFGHIHNIIYVYSFFLHSSFISFYRICRHCFARFYCLTELPVLLLFAVSLFAIDVWLDDLMMGFVVWIDLDRRIILIRHFGWKTCFSQFFFINFCFGLSLPGLFICRFL